MSGENPASCNNKINSCHVERLTMERLVKEWSLIGYLPPVTHDSTVVSPMMPQYDAVF